MSPMFRKAIIGILLTANLFWFWDILSFKSRAKHAPGVVTQWILMPPFFRGRAYNIQYKFILPGGEIRSKTTSTGTGDTWILPSVGQKLDVLYMPGDTGQVRINGLYDLWFPEAYGFLGMDYLGLMLFVAGWEMRPRKKNQKVVQSP